MHLAPPAQHLPSSSCKSAKKKLLQHLQVVTAASFLPSLAAMAGVCSEECKRDLRGSGIMISKGLFLTTEGLISQFVISATLSI